MPKPMIMVYSHTAGYRHRSIPDGVAMIREQGAAHGFDVFHTEEPTDFSPELLKRFQAVVWLSTTGDALKPEGKAAFEAYIRAGGGYVGVHAAADTEYQWPWYGQLLGCDAWFRNHPKIQEARIDVADVQHVSTRHLPAWFTLTDEWYNFRKNPAPCVSVLLRLDEGSYEAGDGTMGADHPIAWLHEFEGGRSWYTGLGHRRELYDDSRFREHVLGGILWAAKMSAEPRR